jgi:uncharacterized membrane protein YciS (DUF1049 family)
LRTFFRIVILGPIAIVVVALAVVNNQLVTLVLDPFNPVAPFFSLTVPLYVVFFATLALGVLIGGVGSWFGQGSVRRAARQSRRETARLKAEIERQHAQEGPETLALRGPGT